MVHSPVVLMVEPYGLILTVSYEQRSSEYTRVTKSSIKFNEEEEVVHNEEVVVHWEDVVVHRPRN